MLYSFIKFSNPKNLFKGGYDKGKVFTSLMKENKLLFSIPNTNIFKNQHIQISYTFPECMVEIFHIILPFISLSKTSYVFTNTWISCYSLRVTFSHN